MLTAEWAPYCLHFHFEARTSRQTMHVKDTYFVRVYDPSRPDAGVGIGECALFRGLSADDRPDYEDMLAEACKDPLGAVTGPYSSIRFGFESALASLDAAQSTAPPSDWLAGRRGIPINGLIWMGDKATMRARIAEKLDAGFRVLKLKIGGIAFDDELELLREVRRSFSRSDLEIRLDANGAFTPANALSRLSALSVFGIHSLEQPVKAGQIAEMARICLESPIPIALDEELIGVRSEHESRALVEAIKPQYIILKPSLCGGFSATGTYIHIARENGIGWWLTSALESNIGLAAIGSWLSREHPEATMPQGLGTGQLYTDNIESPLEMQGAELRYNPDRRWHIPDNIQWRH